MPTQYSFLGSPLGSLMASTFSNLAAIAILLLNIFLAYWLLRGEGERGEGVMDSKGCVTTESSPLGYRQWRLEELREYDGLRSSQIVLAIDWRVYDVTKSKHYYGPGGSYAVLAGRDASRALATNRLPKLNPDELQHWDDLLDLTPEERSTLNGWVDFFEHKYPRVGTLVQVKSFGGSDQEDQIDDQVHGAFIQGENPDFYNL